MAKPIPAATVEGARARAATADVFGGLLLVAATIVAYAPALHGGFLWDDVAHVTSRELQSFAGLRRIWFELGATQQYYPVLHSAFWVEHRLWGDAVLGYHLTNVLLHAAAALLVVGVVRQLERGQADRATWGRGAAWLAGAVFALHPVGVESVAWISEQKNTLSAVFYLAAALAYLRFDEERRPARYAAATGWFVLALLTKTVTATLPAALLVVFWWRRGALEWRKDVRPLVPWFVLALLAGATTAWVERTLIGAQGADFALGAVERGLLAGRALWFYLGKLVWPADLVFIYPRWRIDAGAAWQYLFPVAAVAVAAALTVLARRRRGPLAGFLIFAGTLFPALGFFNVFPFLYSYVADHFQYLASLGVIVPVVAGATLGARRLPEELRKLGPAAAMLLLVTLGGLTWRQCGDYGDVETLYRATLRKNPDCSLAHNNLGEILMADARRTDEAAGHFAAALRSDPRNAQAEVNLGLIAVRDPARWAEAIAHYEAALRLRPNLFEAHNNLAVALAKRPERWPEAVGHYQAALRLQPDAAGVHDNLGTLLLRMPGRLDEAVAQFEAAVRDEPGSSGYRDHLGVALANVPARRGEARAQFEVAVRLDPRSAEAHNNLGKALVEIPERSGDAIREYETALRLRPEFAEAHRNLGETLTQVPGRTAEGIEHLETAVRLAPGSAEAQGALGKALLQEGRAEEAVSHLAAAVRSSPRAVELQTNLGIALAKGPGRLGEAAEHLEAAIALEPATMQAQYALGVVLAEWPERREEARAHFEAAVRINPEFAPAREWIERLKAER